MSAVNYTMVRVHHVTGRGGDMLVESSGAVGLSQTLTSAGTVTTGTCPAAEMIPGICWSMDIGITAGTFAPGDALTFTTGSDTGTATLLQIVIDGSDAYLICGEITGTKPTAASTVANDTGGAADVGTPIPYAGEPGRNAWHLAWAVENSGTDDVYVAFGSTPNPEGVLTTTASTPRRIVHAGTVRHFGVRRMGDKIGIIEV